MIGGESTTLDRLQEVAAAILLGFAAVALGRAYLRALRTWRLCSGAELGVGAAAVFVGAVLRFAVVPLWIATVFIGYRLTQQAADLVPASHYGLGASALYHAVFAVFPVDHDVLMWTNSVIGVLTLPLAGAFAARLWPERGAAAAFTGLLALTPLFLRNDNSDANNVPSLLFIFGALVLWEEYLSTRARGALAGAMALFFMALVSRPEMPLVLPLLIALMTLALRPLHAFWRDPFLYALIACGSVLATPHVLHVLTAQAELYPNVAAGALSRVPAVLFGENTVLWPELFPPGVALFSLAALVLPPYSDWRRRALVAVAALVLLAVYSIDTCHANMARVHVPGAMFTCLLAAAGIARTWQRLRHYVMRVVIVLALCASALPSVRALWAATNEQAEEDFLNEALPALPSREPFLLVRLGFDDLEHDAKSGGFTHQHFPDYRLTPPRGRAILSTAGEFLRAPRFDLPVYFHVGMRCYARFRNPNTPPPMGEDRRAACTEMERRFALDVIRERIVQNRGDVWIEYYGDAPTLRLGLYRVSPRTVAAP